MKNLFFLIGIRLKNQLIYRYDILVSLFSNLLQLCGILLYWHFLFHEQQVSVPYSQTDMYWYYTIIFFIQNTVNLDLAFSTEEDIALGKLSQYILTPCSFRTIKLAEYLSQNLPFLCGFLFFSLLLSVTGTFTISLSFFLLIIESLFFYFILSLTIGLFTVWMKRIDNLLYFLMTLVTLLSGSLVPLSRFPVMLQYNPFALSLGSIANLLLGHGNGWKECGVLFLWCVIQYLLYLLVQKKAFKNYEAYGG